ncbi:MAG TPA: NAD(P)H-hydrate dehydratase [Cytophagales bacterium]|nr:NAD(P)H-hydrate dehydratase [Cytophagales bacterium]
MKILSASQIKALDQFTIQKENISSWDLMERASHAFCKWLIDKFDQSYTITIIAGTGNNGGDGLAIARILKKEGYAVKVMVVGNHEQGSPDFLINFNNLPKDHSLSMIQSELDLDVLHDSDIIIDALFGSGINRALTGVYAKVVNHINQSKAIKISVDVPSGLFCDLLNAPGDPIVHANYCLTFQLPKFSFLLPENEKFLGEWSVVDIGLDEAYIEHQTGDHHFLLKEDVQSKVKARAKFSHKGTFGHALIMAGSFGKIGAAALASKACLRTGVGLLTVQVPKCGYQIIQTSVPEAMCIADDSENELSTLQNLVLYDAVGIGPGIGKSNLTKNLLENVLTTYKKPLVIDADGLNILSEYPELLKTLPSKSILTPHPKEFERLTEKAKNSSKRLELLRYFSVNNDCITVLKGAYSVICSSEGTIYFNSTGNPGMATGGSGDVLTGIITSLLAQGYSSIDAAILGVYLHGYAGDCAAYQLGFESMIASDIIEHIYQFFKIIH